MTFYLLTTLFLFGLIIGSFLNVLILRHDKPKSASDGRSECMTCKKPLSWYELIPLLSWIMQGGKCRGCKKAVSVQYPLVELATGLVFVFGAYVYFGLGDISYLFDLSLGVIIGFGALLVSLAILVAIFVYDLYHQIIPDEWSLTFALATLTYALVIFAREGALWTETFWWHMVAGPILFMPFYLLWKVSDGKWIGLGDGKLAVGIGWLLGLSLGLSAVVYSFWLGAVYAIVMVIIQKISSQKELTMKTAIAFGPFMIVATLLVFWLQTNTLQFVEVLGGMFS